MIHLDLSSDDALFLGQQLASRVRQVENELVHTDKRQLQADIARDLKRLEHLHQRVTHALALSESKVAV